MGPKSMFKVGSVNCEYTFTEAQTEFKQKTLKRRPIREVTAPRLDPGNSDRAQMLCFSMIGFPAKDFRDYSGAKRPILHDGRLTLVTLWASWCQPCVHELAEYVRQKERLRKAGIDIVVLSVDHSSDSEEARAAELQFLQQLQFPFRSGIAEDKLLTQLHMLHDIIFEIRRPLPVPTSFLVDRKRRIMGIYKGPVTVDELLRDFEKLKVKTTNEWRMATMPFPGKWEMKPKRRHLFDFVSNLADQGFLEEAREYVTRDQKMFVTHPDWKILQRKLQRRP